MWAWSVLQMQHTGLWLMGQRSGNSVPFGQWHLGWLALWGWFSLHMWPDKTEERMCSFFLGWSEQEQAFQLVLLTLGQNCRAMVARSAAASTLFYIHLSVFPLHPEINYWPDLWFLTSGKLAWFKQPVVSVSAEVVPRGHHSTFPSPCALRAYSPCPKMLGKGQKCGTWQDCHVVVLRLCCGCVENTLLQTLESSSPLQYHISWDMFPISLNLTFNF